MNTHRPSPWWPVHPLGQIGLCLLLLAAFCAVGLRPVSGYETILLNNGVLFARLDPFAAIVCAAVWYLILTAVRALWLRTLPDIDPLAAYVAAGVIERITPPSAPSDPSDLSDSQSSTRQPGRKSPVEQFTLAFFWFVVALSVCVFAWGGMVLLLDLLGFQIRTN